jgi:hypothetical protein
MVALAHICQQYGRFRDARQLLEAAGAHGELLALCVFQGDFPGLQAHARQVCASAACCSPCSACICPCSGVLLLTVVSNLFALLI